MATKIQVRRDTAANWAATNPVLAAGEPGMEVDTGVVKYGNGTDAWSDLARSQSSGNEFSMKAWSGNDWKFISSAGGKSFTFKTAGHVRTNVRVENSQSWDDTTGFDVKISDHPKIMDSVAVAYDNYANNNGSRPYIFINGSWSGHVDHYEVNGDIMTVYITYGPYNLSPNDTIQFAGWSKGTQALYNTYFSSTGPNSGNRAYDGKYWQPTADASNTNVVTVDLTNVQFEVATALESGSGKNYIVFDEYSNNDGRRITNVTKNGNNYTISFTGAPINVKKKSQKTLVCRPAVTASGYQLYLDPQEYPQLIDYLNVDDNSAYITINGGSQIPVYYFWPRGGLSSGNDGITYHGYWAIGTDTYMEYNTADTIELHYWEKGTFVRIDAWGENMGQLGAMNTSSNHGYRWFSWEEDLPHVKNAKGNGVQGGWIDYHVQATWPDTSSRNWDNRTFSVFFDPKGSDNNSDDVTGLNNFRYQGFPTFSGPAQPNNYGGGAFSGPWYNLQFQTMWDFYEDGIFFHAYHDKYDDNNQQEVKIDIMWNARIFYADTPMLEPSDR